MRNSNKSRQEQNQFVLKEKKDQKQLILFKAAQKDPNVALAIIDYKKTQMKQHYELEKKKEDNNASKSNTKVICYSAVIIAIVAGTVYKSQSQDQKQIILAKLKQVVQIQKVLKPQKIISEVGNSAAKILGKAFAWVSSSWFQRS